MFFSHCLTNGGDLTSGFAETPILAPPAFFTLNLNGKAALLLNRCWMAAF